MKKNVLIPAFISLMLTSVSTGSLAIAIESQDIQSNNSNLIAQNTGINSNLSNSRGDNLTRIIVFLGLIGTGALSWYLFQSKSRQSNQPVLQRNINSETALLDRVSPKLRRQLLRLINDPKTANRLLVGIHNNNSDRSPNWLAEKAIYDLKRGR